MTLAIAAADARRLATAILTGADALEQRGVLANGGIRRYDGNQSMIPKIPTELERTCHPKVVTAAEFAAAREVMKGRRSEQTEGRDVRAPRRLLSGLLKCGKCGGGMSVQGTRTGITRVRCSRAVESGTCTNKLAYRLERIEKAVVEGIETQLENPVLLNAYIDAYREERMREVSEAIRNRSSPERKRSQLKGQIGRMLDLYAKGTMSLELFEARALPLQDEWKAIGEQLATMPTTPVIELHPQAVAQYQRTAADLA